MITALAVAASLVLTACAAGDVSPPTTGSTTPTTTSAATTTTAPSTASPSETETPLLPICVPPYPSGAPNAETVFCADPSRMQRASVVRIVDGDTLRATVDGVEEPIRLFGIDTPERGEQCFAESTDVLRALVAMHGGQILLLPDERNRDRYDRLLRYVYTPEGLSIDAMLVATGYAYAWTDDGALRNALAAVEAEARAGARGCLWQ
jgi:micrococcal nuclease